MSVSSDVLQRALQNPVIQEEAEMDLYHIYTTSMSICTWFRDVTANRNAGIVIDYMPGDIKGRHHRRNSYAGLETWT